MQIDPRRWPGRVVPSTDADVDIAVESLCVRASWTDADRRWVIAHAIARLALTLLADLFFLLDTHCDCFLEFVELGEE